MRPDTALRTLVGIVGIAVFAATVGHAGLVLAQAATAPSAELQSAKKELSDLRKRFEEVRRAVEQGEAVAPLRKARDEAARAAEDAEKADVALAAARKAQKEAQASYDKVLRAKVEASADGAAIVRRLVDLDRQRDALRLADELAKVKLESPYSPVQRALERDAELAALRKAYQALDPEKDQAARDAARAKYQEARAARLATLDEARALLDERAKLKASLAELDQQERAAETDLRSVREQVRGSADADLKGAADALAAAAKAVEAARDAEKLRAAREASRAASKALRDRVAELLAADPNAKSLAGALEAKAARVAELEKGAR